MTIGDLVVSKRTGHVGIVLDATTDDARDHDLVKLFIEGSKTVWVRSSWFNIVRRAKNRN